MVNVLRRLLACVTGNSFGETTPTFLYLQGEFRLLEACLERYRTAAEEDKFVVGFPYIRESF